MQLVYHFEAECGLPQADMLHSLCVFPLRFVSRIDLKKKWFVKTRTMTVYLYGFI